MCQIQMPKSTYLNERYPTPEMLRRWAFDPNIYFFEQDETDLVELDLAHLPLLLNFATDGDCPKRKSCLELASQFIRGNLTTRCIETCLGIDQFITQEIRSHPSTAQLAENFGFAFDRLVNPQRLSRSEANQLASFILPCNAHLNSVCSSTGNRVSGFDEYRFTAGNYTTYLYIDLETGGWLAKPQQVHTLDA